MKMRDLLMPTIKEALGEREAPAEGVGDVTYKDDYDEGIPF